MIQWLQSNLHECHFYSTKNLTDNTGFLKLQAACNAKVLSKGLKLLCWYPCMYVSLWIHSHGCLMCYSFVSVLPHWKYCLKKHVLKKLNGSTGISGCKCMVDISGRNPAPGLVRSWTIHYHRQLLLEPLSSPTYCLLLQILVSARSWPLVWKADLGNRCLVVCWHNPLFEYQMVNLEILFLFLESCTLFEVSC